MVCRHTMRGHPQSKVQRVLGMRLKKGRSHLYLIWKGFGLDTLGK